MITPFRALPLLLLIPIVSTAGEVTGSATNVAAASATVSHWIVASDPASRTMIECRSLPVGIDDITVLAWKTTPDAVANPGSDAARPGGTSASGLALAGVLGEPARGALDVAFTLADQAPARLELLDVQGRRLDVAAVGDLGPGPHLVRLGGAVGPGSGVYFVRLVSGGRSLTRRATVLR